MGKSTQEGCVKQIYQSMYNNGNADYFISHPIILPQGKVIMNTTESKARGALKKIMADELNK